MQLKCKICGSMIDTQKTPAGGIGFNFATDNEDIFNAAKMGKEFLALVNHLMTEHPDEAMKLYAGLLSSLYAVFEISECNDPDMTL